MTKVAGAKNPADSLRDFQDQLMRVTVQVGGASGDKDDDPAVGGARSWKTTRGLWSRRFG